MELSFEINDGVNEIGEFYNAIIVGIENLYNNKLIDFKSDSDHQQTQTFLNQKATAPITSLDAAKAALDLICAQGEGFELKPGVFGPVVFNDGNSDLSDDIENLPKNPNNEKTHFIKFVECLVGRNVTEVKLVQDQADIKTYLFFYGKDSMYKVDFEKEIYPLSNFVKPADDKLFNTEYKTLLENLTAGLQRGMLHGVSDMYELPPKFKQCMDKNVYPTFEIKDFPLPPSVQTKIIC